MCAVIIMAIILSILLLVSFFFFFLNLLLLLLSGGTPMQPSKTHMECTEGLQDRQEKAFQPASSQDYPGYVCLFVCVLVSIYSCLCVSVFLYFCLCFCIFNTTSTHFHIHINTSKTHFHTDVRELGSKLVIVKGDDDLSRAANINATLLTNIMIRWLGVKIKTIIAH